MSLKLVRQRRRTMSSINIADFRCGWRGGRRRTRFRGRGTVYRIATSSE